MRKQLFLLMTLILFLSYSLSSAEALATNRLEVVVRLKATDNDSGVDLMSFSFDNELWTEPEAFSLEKEMKLLDGEDGVRCVYVKFSDKAGNWSEAISACVTLDRIPPTGEVVIMVIVKEGNDDTTN